jgi:hypothetical protein
MPGTEDGAGECVGSVAGAVVRDDSLGTCDAVDGEPGRGSVKNSIAVVAFSSGKASVSARRE